MYERSKMDNEQNNLHQYTPFTHEEFYQRYYVHRVAASAIVVNNNNKILLVKEIRRGKYMWGLPGGILERQESLIQGLLREVKEETNCDIEAFGFLGLTNWAGKSIFKDDPYTQSGFHIIMAARLVSGEPKPDGEEVFETGFFSTAEFESMQVHSSILKMYTAIQEKKYIPLQSSTFENDDAYRIIFSPF